MLSHTRRTIASSLAILAAVVACASPDNVTKPAEDVVAPKMSVGFETPPAGFSTSQTRAVPTPTSRSGASFLGSFTNEIVTYNTETAGNMVNIAFDLYVLGSWDGRGSQAQHGAFGENYFQLGISCAGSSVIHDVITTSFSNQKTVQQNYPRSIYQGGGTKAYSGSYAVGSLGFTSADVNVASFSSSADSEYHLAYNVASPCGSDDVVIVFRGSPDNWQGAFDESWGIDNVDVSVN